MSKTPDTQQERLALVSSLYGTGTVLYWMLIGLSCLISWTLHPRKRRSGSVDDDLVAFLSFGFVARGHLVSQTCTFPAGVDASLSMAHPALLQHIAALEASIKVTETSMQICVILFLAAVCFKCVRRACLIALDGLFGLSAELYLRIRLGSLTDDLTFQRAFPCSCWRSLPCRRNPDCHFNVGCAGTHLDSILSDSSFYVGCP